MENKLSEKFTGTVEQITEHFKRKWCRKFNTKENMWKHVGNDILDGLKIKNQKTGLVISFWAGSSGTNWGAVDDLGGCYDLSFYREDIFEVIVPEKNEEVPFTKCLECHYAACEHHQSCILKM